MTLRRPSWWIVGPTCLAAGVLIGRLLPPADAEGLWTGPAGPTGVPAAMVPGPTPQLPSLAPIVDRVAGGVLGVQALFPPDANVADPASATVGVISGTGFVVNKHGLVVTSHHVVGGAAEIGVWTTGGQRFSATLVGADEVNDLAFLRILEPPDELPVLELGCSEDVRAGDWIVSIGSPFGLPRSVTVGNVSYVGRHLRDVTRVSNDYLQFSAPVNEGNSGGPVLDLEGRVIGVTTQVMKSAQGMSFAVPSRTLKWAMERAGSSPDGRVHRGYLGIEFRAIAGRRFGELEPGVEVTRVSEGSPAAVAGVMRGDTLRGIDGQDIRDPYEFHERISRTPPGRVIELRLQRGGVDLPVVTVVLGEVLPVPSNQTG